jgi:hypothetical protein
VNFREQMQANKLPVWLQIVVGIFGALLIILVLIAINADDPEPDNTEQESAQSDISEIAEVSDKVKAQRQADMKIFWTGLLRNVERCDSTNNAAIEALQNADSLGIYAVYEKASDAMNDCSDSWMNFNDLKVPSSLSSDQSEMLAEYKDDCQTAYFSRKESLETMLEFIDGDDRPSVVQQFKEQAQMAQQGGIACIAGIMSVAMETGLKASDLPTER